MSRTNVFYPSVPSRAKRQQQSDGLSLTEWFIVFSTGLSGLLLSDPFYGGYLGRSFLSKGLTFGLVTVGVVAHLIARATYAPALFSQSVRRVFSRFLPIVLLALFIVGGSLWGIKIDHIKSHFMSFGLSMFFLPALAISVDCASNPMLFLKRMALMYVATVLLMLGEMPFRQSTHHEEIFLAVPLGLYFLGARKPNILTFLLGVGMIGVCGLSVKNTTYIMMVLVALILMYLWLRRFAKLKDGLKSVLFSMLALMLAGVLVTAVAIAYYKFKHLLPHGNTEYREEMYRIAWGKFVDSPIWGTGFAGEAVAYFGLYKVDMATQYLPTHSDIMDILANGGLIGILLWLLTVGNIPLFMFAALKRLCRPDAVTNEAGWRWLLVMSTYQLCAVVTYAVNPPLINPVHGFWIWGGMAMTWALWRQLDVAEKGTGLVTPRRKH